MRCIRYLYLNIAIAALVCWVAVAGIVNRREITLGQIAYHDELCEVVVSVGLLQIDNKPQDIAFKPLRDVLKRRSQQVLRLEQENLGQISWSREDVVDEKNRLKALDAEVAAIESAIRLTGVLPQSHRFSLLPVWSLIVATLAILQWRRVLRSYRIHKQRCINCGYDLRATPSRCPECGTEQPSATLIKPAIE
jgi:hypothetical protein